MSSGSAFRAMFRLARRPSHYLTDGVPSPPSIKRRHAACYKTLASSVARTSISSFSGRVGG
jgi:hypothetical protein